MNKPQMVKIPTCTEVVLTPEDGKIPDTILILGAHKDSKSNEMEMAGFARLSALPQDMRDQVNAHIKDIPVEEYIKLREAHSRIAKNQMQAVEEENGLYISWYP